MVEKLKRQAARSYEQEMQIWAALAPHMKKKAEPPKLPEILK